MKKHQDAYIIDEREESSMVSMWTVFLCITRGTNKPYRIFNGRYAQILGCVEDYINENTGNYRIPARINGIKVESVQDEWILGGELRWNNSADTVECREFESDALRDWLDSNNWQSPDVREKLRTAMTVLVGPLKCRAPFYLCSRSGLHKLVLLSEFEVLKDEMVERASEGFKTKKEARQEWRRRTELR